MTYRFDKGTLYSERKIVVLESKVPVADWKTYKKFADSVGVGNEVYVQLRRATGETAAVTAASGTGSANSQLQQIYSQLEDAYQYGRLTEMDALLKRMQEINPKAPRLLAWEGAVAVLHHHLQEGIDDNRKELAAFPEEYDRYGAIVSIQMQQRDRAGAEETLREWAKANPADPQPLMQLSGLLTLDGKFPESVQAAKDAVSRVPAGSDKHGQAVLLLGNAQMKAGMKEDGHATLRGLLQTTDDPELMNDAAFELADAKQELPLDEAKERVALDKLTTETESWTLDESAQTLRAKTSLLVASWDTMGWILFREGKPAEAKPFIEAAWMNSPKPDLKEHLDAVNAALGVKPAARYKLPKADITVTADAIGQQARTFPLGPAQGLQGVAEYRLLLSHGKVERIEPAGEKKLDGAEAMVKAADLNKLFPNGSQAKLVRGAMVNCYNGKCLLLFEPLM